MIFVVDTETTGKDTATAKIVEIAAVDVYIPSSGDPVISSSSSSLVYPGCEIPPDASAVHHLIDEDVEDAPTISKALKIVLGGDFASRLDDIYVAHNARYDRAMLPMLHEHQWIDTYRCSLHLFPDAPGHSNQALRYWLKLPVPRDIPTHRALGDAIVTAHIFCHMLGVASLGDLILLSTKAVILNTMPFGKHYGEAFDAIPLDYLHWLQRQKLDDFDVKHTVKKELERRNGSPKPKESPNE